MPIGLLRALARIMYGDHCTLLVRRAMLAPEGRARARAAMAAPCRPGRAGQGTAAAAAWTGGARRAPARPCLRADRAAESSSWGPLSLLRAPAPARLPSLCRPSWPLPGPWMAC